LLLVYRLHLKKKIKKRVLKCVMISEKFFNSVKNVRTELFIRAMNLGHRKEKVVISRGE
jgi:hypothetical protein